jgi:hypothetical protein
MTKPQFTLIPSAYNTSKVYSVLPVNGDGDFDFDRASKGTRVREDGLIEEVTDNVPRLDWYDSNCPSLLLEPLRTNLQVYSEEFDNVIWTKSRTTITANDTISPNGELTADKITGDGTGTSYVYDEISLTNGNTYTISIFVKPIINISSFAINVFGGVGTAPFDLINKTTGTLTGDFTSAKIEDYGNGWLRCSGTLTLSSTTGTKNIGYGLIDFNGDQFYLFGAQVEEGDYPTSYIKTEASTVTRLKDECLNGGDSDLFDITEGTFFTDVTPYNSGNVTVIGLSIGNDTQKIIFQFQSNGTQVRVFSSGGVSFYANLTFDQRNKIAVTFKENEYKFFINGALVGSDTSATVPIGMDRLNFSNSVGNGSGFEGEVHDTRVYNTVLTEAEAIKLTTI